MATVADPFDDIDPAIEGDHLTTLPPEYLESLLLNREAWLGQAVDQLRGVLGQAGATVPPKVRVSVGFNYKAARRTSGVCFRTSHSKDKINNIFITPELDDPIDVLATLTHELIHAADNCTSGHTGFFRMIARAVGLEGKLTQTHAGPDLRVILGGLVEELGPYPHAKLVISANNKTARTRMLKATCDDTDCMCADDDGNRYTIRLTRKWADVGMPSCPGGAQMVLYEA